GHRKAGRPRRRLGQPQDRLRRRRGRGRNQAQESARSRCSGDRRGRVPCDAGGRMSGPTSADPAREQGRATILVFGKVTGAFFLPSEQSEAMSLGLTGEVRNLPEGAVEAIVEGERQYVEQFADWCKRGPPQAVVESTHVRWAAFKGEFRTFMVAR